MFIDVSGRQDQMAPSDENHLQFLVDTLLEALSLESSCIVQQVTCNLLSRVSDLIESRKEFDESDKSKIGNLFAAVGVMKYTKKQGVTLSVDFGVLRGLRIDDVVHGFNEAVVNQKLFLGVDGKRRRIENPPTNSDLDLLSFSLISRSSGKMVLTHSVPSLSAE